MAANRGDRSRYQAHWPQRGARGVFQPAATVAGNIDNESPSTSGTTQVDGIVWVNAVPNREDRSGTPVAAGNAPGTGRSSVPQRVSPPARPLARADVAGPKGRFLLWVDAVGGYLVCLDDRIVIGRAGPDSQADVPLMGDLSRNHATLVAMARAICSRQIMRRSLTVSQ